MGQYWILVNLDKLQKHEFWKLGECCSHFDIHNRLSGSKFTVTTAAEYIREREERRPADVYRRIEQRQSALLTKLPLEVISLCVGFMDTLLDKACFALTCLDAWDLAYPDIVKYLRAHQSWAGDRILCIGDYTDIDDIPPNVLNDEEPAVLNDVKTGKWQPPPDAGDSYDPEFICMLDFLDARGVKKFSSPVDDVHKWLKKHVPFDHSTRYYAQHPSCLWSEMVWDFPRGGDAAGVVLRNLTTHEYIRSDAYLDAQDDEELDPEGRSPIHFWGLADILLLRIAWADDSDGRWASMMKQQDAHCAWAGHRFDFAEEDDLPCDEEGEVLPPWKDVSDELIDELLRCRGWHGGYGYY